MPTRIEVQFPDGTSLYPTTVQVNNNGVLRITYDDYVCHYAPNAWSRVTELTYRAEDLTP